jgi:EH domain-containing protein 1
MSRGAAGTAGASATSVRILMAPDGKKSRKLGAQYEELILESEKKADLVIEGLKKYYKEYIKPLEVVYRFDAWHSPPLSDCDMEFLLVTVIGNFSCGKTSFLEYILERSFGGRVGPEPTTDTFTAIMWGDREQKIPGNALAAMRDRPFTALQRFGMNFLNRFDGVLCPSPILRKLTFIDTPGVLAGEKQRVHRSYDFPQVIEWFAGRSDRILVFFDAHKLDISDELKSVIEALGGNEDKVRVILNKADAVSAQELMRVYGALMWSLARVFKFPEVVRVFVGSFWGQPYVRTDNEKLLMQEEAELLADLRSLPRNAAIRRVNEIVKRARQVRTHALILDHLTRQFSFFGKSKKQAKLLEKMQDEFLHVHKTQQIPVGDFPHLGRFCDVLKEFEIHRFPEIDKKLLSKLDWALDTGIPELMKMMPPEISQSEATAHFSATALAHEQPPSYTAGGAGAGSASAGDDGLVPAPSALGVLSGVPGGLGAAVFNPFDDDAELPVHWAISDYDRQRHMSSFFGLKLVSGKLSGANAKSLLMQSGLPNSDLKHLWGLCDIDKDGSLDVDEYVLVNYLIEQLRNNPDYKLPNELDVSLIPPSKRELWNQNQAGTSGGAPRPPARPARN